MKFLPILLVICILFGLSACKDDPCDRFTCLNGATCNNGDCECTLGFTGADCGETLTLSFDRIVGAAGSSEGEFKFENFHPAWGMAHDGTYLYVADNGNHRIQRFDAGYAVKDWLGYLGVLLAGIRVAPPMAIGPLG